VDNVQVYLDKAAAHWAGKLSFRRLRFLPERSHAEYRSGRKYDWTVEGEIKQLKQIRLTPAKL
jgi:hypothetical protein